MAEQAALRKRSTTGKSLTATCKLLTEVLDGDDDVPPTLEMLTKHILSNEQAWDKFDAAHFAFLELVCAMTYRLQRTMGTQGAK